MSKWFLFFLFLLLCLIFNLCHFLFYKCGACRGHRSIIQLFKNLFVHLSAKTDENGKEIIQPFKIYLYIYQPKQMKMAKTFKIQNFMIL